MTDAKREPITRPACGTLAGYAKHRYYGESPCDPCKAGNTEYQRTWMEINGRSVDNKLRQTARQRALRRLAKEFPDRYQVVLSEELAALGVLAVEQ